ncbi:MAG TPA: SDR family NAD(P)-dependent oxidoreductase [Microthrixaceae bacterium]|nr:SDR family NAD(P)-dependent oxidoreductase [Microthrixaceae bacterium]
MEREPDELAATPHQSDADRPPVGEPLVVSRHNPGARPAWTGSADVPAGAAEPAAAPVASMEGRVAVVTAATGALGVALAAEMVGRGARVLLVDDDLDGLLDVVDSLAPAHAVPVRCDLGSDADVAAACDFVMRSTAVDVVVHVGRREGDGDDADADAEVRPVGRNALDDRYRADVRGPLGLIDGLFPVTGSAPTVVLVDPPRSTRDPWGSVATDLVVEHLPVHDGLRVTRATCSEDLDPAEFAGAVIDLLGRDDVGVSRVELVGPARSAPAGTAATDTGTWLDGGEGTGR